MVTVALLVRLEAKPGKEAEVESFLRSGLPLAQEEPATTAWLQFVWDPRPLVFLTPSRMTLVARPICQAALPQP